MSYEAYLTVTFQKSIKLLKKKFRSVKDDLLGVIQALEKDPTIGYPIPGWDKEIWKIRAASSDIKRKKSGGFRLIYFWMPDQVRHDVRRTFYGIVILRQEWVLFL